MESDATLPQAVWLAKLLDAGEGRHISWNIKPNWWWHNPINPYSLRLTHGAWALFNDKMQEESKFKFYKFELETKILPKTLLQLERHFTAPYYIKTLKTLYVCGETEAMMLGLHANNLQNYLDNFER